MGVRYPLPYLNVTISPDPIVSNKPVTFNISGIAPTKIYQKSTVSITFIDTNHVGIPQKFHDDFCKLSKLKCPVKTHTHFDFLYKIVPESLSDSYAILVKILDSSTKTLMCAHSGTILTGDIF